VTVLFGAVLISVGNLLPRLRPNAVFGIRTARTLTDRAVWIQTHRLAGYVVVAVGGTMAAAPVLLPPGRWVRNVVSLVAVFAAFLFALRFRRYSVVPLRDGHP
jgi:uncharacterized membrane protein